MLPNVVLSPSPPVYNNHHHHSHLHHHSSSHHHNLINSSAFKHLSSSDSSSPSSVSGYFMENLLRVNSVIGEQSFNSLINNSAFKSELELATMSSTNLKERSITSSLLFLGGTSSSMAPSASPTNQGVHFI